MENSRLKLHNLLLTLGVPNIYYQMPSNLLLKYPCIKYELDDIINDNADDSVYNQKRKYKITYMCHDSQSDVIDKLSKMKLCKCDRFYWSNGIYHSVFTIMY